MNPLTFLKDKIHTFCLNLALRIFSGLDDDFKRMCVLSIIHSKWVGGDIVTERYVKAKTLNQQMGLVKDPNALKFPVCIADHCLVDMPTLTEATNSGEFGWERIRKCLPAWLRYSDEQTIRNDVQRVFSLCMPTPIHA
jgi:hypothetical protein